MKTAARVVFVLGVLLAALALFGHYKGRRDAGEIQFAADFRPTGVRLSGFRVWNHDEATREAISCRGLGGTATLGSLTVTLTYVGGDRDGLDASLDVASVESGTIVFDVGGFAPPDPPDRMVLQVPFKRNPKKAPR